MHVVLCLSWFQDTSFGYFVLCCLSWLIPSALTSRSECPALAHWDSCHAALACARQELQGTWPWSRPRMFWSVTHPETRSVSTEIREFWWAEVNSQGCLTLTPKEQIPTEVFPAILRLQYEFSCMITVGGVESHKTSPSVKKCLSANMCNSWELDYHLQSHH